LVVNHVVQVGNLALRVRDDGELEVGAADLVNVLDPLVVRVDVVGALFGLVTRTYCHIKETSTDQTDELDTKGVELGLELGESTELGGANGSKVILSILVSSEVWYTFLTSPTG
jgi:hypothetical protein